MTCSNCEFVGGPLGGRTLSIDDEKIVQWWAVSDPERVYFPDRRPPDMRHVTFQRWKYERTGPNRFELSDEGDP
jgi:hypothetical protein